MGQIQFDHPCHTGGKFYEQGAVVDEATLPAEWVGPAIEAKFISRVDASPSATGTPGSVPQPGASIPGASAPSGTIPGATPKTVPPDVKAALDAATAGKAS